MQVSAGWPGAADVSRRPLRMRAIMKLKISVQALAHLSMRMYMSLPYSDRILSGFMTLKRLPTSNTSCTAWQRQGRGGLLLRAHLSFPCHCSFRTSHSHLLTEARTCHAFQQVSACRGTCKPRARDLVYISSHPKRRAATAPQRM